jgi:hypothetical protein
MLIRKFINLNIKNYIKDLPKKNIFPVGHGDVIHISSFNELYEVNNPFHKPLEPLINFHLNILDNNNLKYDKRKIFIENREIIFKNNSFDGRLHQDSINDEGESCYTAVYYYRLDKDVKGGNLIFHPFGKYKPKEDTIIYFDGDIKHKIGYTYGTGIRGTIITNIKKIL